MSADNPVLLACQIADGRLQPGGPGGGLFLRHIEGLISGGYLIPCAVRESEAAASNQCQGICASGKRCANNVAPGRKKYCGVHA